MDSVLIHPSFWWCKWTSLKNSFSVLFRNCFAAHLFCSRSFIHTIKCLRLFTLLSLSRAYSLQIFSLTLFATDVRICFITYKLAIATTNSTNRFIIFRPSLVLTKINDIWTVCIWFALIILANKRCRTAKLNNRILFRGFLPGFAAITSRSC